MKSPKVTLRSAAATTGSYVASTEMQCADSEYVHLLVTVSGTTAGDIVKVIAEGTFDEPGVASRTWVPFKAADGSVTSGTVGTVPSGAVYTNLGFAKPTLYDHYIETPAATGSSQTILVPEVFALCGFKAFRVQVVGSTGTPTCKVEAVAFSV